MDVVRWDHRPDGLRRPALIAAFGGWNDAASSASTALAYLGEHLDAARFATLDAEEFYDFQSTRPLIDLSEPGTQTVTWPELELYALRAPAAPRDLIVLAGPEPSMRWRTLCETAVGVARDLGVELVVTLGALLADVAHTRPIQLTGMASDERLIEGLGVRTPTYQGPTGIVGVLHHAFSEAAFACASLWAPVPHYAAGVANPKGAMALLNGVEAVTGVGLDLAELQASVRDHEEQISRAVASDQRLQALVERLETAGEDERPRFDPGDLPSGDELAEELERYLRQREEPDTE